MKKLMLSTTFAAVLALPAVVTAVGQDGRIGPVAAPITVNSSTQAPALANWSIDIAQQEKAFSALRASSGRQLKASSDLVTIFRPLTPCRLVATFGGPGPVGGNTPVTANTRRTITPAGACGIPTSSVTGLSASVVTLNTTPLNGGSFSLVAPGGVTNGVNGVYNQSTSSQWAGSSVNIPTDSGGSFDFFTALSTVHIIIDVNGYYQDLNDLDTDTELDIVGNTGGNLLEVVNTASGGNALRVSASSGVALEVGSGKVRSAGAGVGTGTFAFQFSANTAGTASAGTGTGCFSGTSDIHVITHPMLNNTPGAIVFITPKFANGASSGDGNHQNNSVYRALYLDTGSCGGGAGQNKWSIQDKAGANIPNGTKFNVLVISP
jgi:hypothetical protein